MNIDKLLKQVEKPIRYTGEELNMCKKDLKDIKFRYCFCFPDVYEIGMSHLGLRILYDLYNRRNDTYCERAFAPWVDMEKLMRENNIKLFSLETKTNLNEFDMIGFTLQYEMSYSNIINMLELGGVPLLSKDRGENDPFVMAGGPCSYNSEPISDFFDFIVLGEGEELNLEVTDEWIKWKEAKEPRIKFLERIANIEGVYVPSFYDVSYNEDGTIKEIKPNNKNAKEIVTKRIIKDLDKVTYPEKWMVPYLSVVHDRPMLEIFRGCIRGCRFCQAGFLYRPVREKSVEVLEENARNLIKNTGYEELALSSLSTSDYRGFFKLADDLICEFKPKNVNLSLPSLRIDSVSLKLLDEVNNVRKSGLTFAPDRITDETAKVEELRICFGGASTEHMIRALTYAEENGIRVAEFRDGSEFAMGDGSVTLKFWCNTDPSLDMNNQSAQTLVRYGARTILFTADMERPGQISLLTRAAPSALKADLLKYPHHGKTPLEDDFLRAVSPEAAIITNKTVPDWGGVRYLAAKGIPYIYTNQTGVYLHLVTDGEHWIAEQVPQDRVGKIR